jgi:hypothetical protein
MSADGAYDGHTLTTKLRLVLESLQPSKGLGFLCGVVHAQVHALCDEGNSSRLHVVALESRQLWTVADPAETSSADKVGRRWTTLDQSLAGQVVTTNRALSTTDALFLPIRHDSGGDDTVLGVLEVQLQHEHGTFSDSETRALELVCVHLGLCFDYCSTFGAQHKLMSQLGEREQSASLRERVGQVELDFERRLVRAISSLVAWNAKASRREVGTTALREYVDLFSLVPTAVQVITGPLEWAVWYAVDTKGPGSNFPTDNTALKIWTADRAHPHRKTVLSVYDPRGIDPPSDAARTVHHVMQRGHPTHMDCSVFMGWFCEHIVCDDDASGGDRTVHDKGCLDVRMLQPDGHGAFGNRPHSDSPASHFLLVPSQSPGGAVMGLLVLQVGIEVGLPNSQLVSLLRDFSAHVALASTGILERASAREDLASLRRRLQGTRRRADVLQSVEKLWTVASNTQDIFYLFESEIKNKFAISTSVLYADLFLAVRGGQKLWTIKQSIPPRQPVTTSDSPRRTVFAVGQGLAGRVAASGEPVRVGSHVCVVARADKGQVMAIGIVECATNQELETDEKGDMFNGTMSMEDEALITAWLKHVAHAVSHFETLKTCVDGMSEASEALVALQNQLEEVQSTSKERTISIHRYHTAATAGADVCGSLFEDDFYDEIVSNVGSLAYKEDLELVNKIEQSAVALMAATGAIVFLRGTGADLHKTIVAVVDSKQSLEERGATPLFAGQSTTLQAYTLEESDAPFAFQIMRQGKMLRQEVPLRRDLFLTSKMKNLWVGRGLEKVTRIHDPVHMLGAPMLTPNCVAFGAIVVFRTGTRAETPFKKTDMDMMDLFARLSLCGIFYQRRLEFLTNRATAMGVQNEARTERIKRRQEALRMVIGLSSCLTIHAAIAFAKERIARVFRADICNIFLFDAQKQQLVCLENDHRLSVDPDASTMVSRSLFSVNVLHYPDDNEFHEGANRSAVQHASPVLQEWGSNLLTLTCFRVGVDLGPRASAQERENDKKACLVDNILGAVEIANMRIPWNTSLAQELQDVGTAIACFIDRLRRQAQVLKYRAEQGIAMRMDNLRLNEVVENLVSKTQELKEVEKDKKKIALELMHAKKIYVRAEAAEKGLDELTKAVSILEEELVVTMNREQEWKAKIGEVELNFKTAQQKLHHTTGRLEQAELKAFKAEAELEKERERLQCELSTALARVDAAEKRVGVLNATHQLRLNELTNKLAVALKRSNASDQRLQDMIDAAKKGKQSLQRNLATAMKRKDESDRVASEAEAALSITKSKCDGQVAAAKKHLSQVVERLQVIEPTIANLKAENNELWQRLNRTSHTNKVLEQKVVQLTTESEKYAARVRELELTIAENSCRVRRSMGITAGAAAATAANKRPEIPKWHNVPKIPPEERFDWEIENTNIVVQDDIFDRIDTTRQELALYRANIEKG